MTSHENKELGFSRHPYNVMKINLLSIFILWMVLVFMLLCPPGNKIRGESVLSSYSGLK